MQSIRVREKWRPPTKWLYVAMLLLAASGLWGAKVLLVYQDAPGRGAAAQSQWPSGSALVRRPGRATLLVFAHPQCSCTQATLEELAAVLSTNREALPQTHVLFARLGDAPEWRSTPLWAAAAALPGGDARWDPNATEALRFEVKTSGQVLLYDRAGRLTFAGGITSARGHRGENRGAEALKAALTKLPGQDPRFPVFGCSLFGPSSRGFAND